MFLSLAVGVAGCNSSHPPIVDLACANVGYPAPKWRRSASVTATIHSVCLDASTPATQLFRAEIQRLGFSSTSDGCDLALTISAAQPEDSDVPADWQSHAEGYAWTVDGAGTSPIGVTIFAGTDGGAHAALHAIIESFAQTGALATAAADWPSFERRGVIEGFYNRYFSRDERTFTLGLMHQLRQNAYLYAPKDDEYAGYRWRDPYPAEAAGDIQSAASVAADLGIDFVYGISPTLSTNGKDPQGSIRFSSDTDFDLLLGKLKSLQALGVSHFAIQFDDASQSLQHPEDQAVFPTEADAHAALANRLVSALGGRLLFVGGYYSSLTAGWQAYNDRLGALLDPAVDVMWTGPAVFSQRIEVADLTPIDQLLQRNVVLWDNWPTSRMPVDGRAADLFNGAEGILTNATLVGDFGHPVEDFWSVLGPIADYSWDPATYDSGDSFATWQATLARSLSCGR
jgi:hyaluronoglucosaminidase